MLFRSFFFLSKEGMQILGLEPTASNVVDIGHVRKLVDFEKDDELKVAYHLQSYHLNPGKFGLMKVEPAKALFSFRTAQALRTMHGNYPKSFPEGVETTARFLELCEAWHKSCDNNQKKNFLLTNSRTAVNEEIFENIQKFTNIATTMAVGVAKPTANKPTKSQRVPKANNPPKSKKESCVNPNIVRRQQIGRAHV